PAGGAGEARGCQQGGGRVCKGRLHSAVVQGTGGGGGAAGAVLTLTSSALGVGTCVPGTRLALFSRRSCRRLPRAQPGFL
ncbi:unnamed protein product, partial [Ectocarpus sp. 6 AP-2014]